MAKDSTQSTHSTPFSQTLARVKNYGKSIRLKKDFTPLDSHLQATSSPKVQNTKEQKVLKVSMFSALVLAIFGIGFGIVISSLSIIFDGFVALISVGLGALSVITSRYIYKEDDDIFQYGYVRFEPMVNLFKSLVLIFVCVFAFISSVSSIFGGGYEVDVGGAAIYGVCAFVFCLALFIYTHIAYKHLESDLIKVDNIEWQIDCVLYLGAIVAFGMVWVFFNPLEILHTTNLKESRSLAKYIDPALLCVLSVLLCVSPTKIAIANFKDLIMVAPKELDEKVSAVMEHLSARYGFSDYDTHTAKSGRFFMIEINILVGKDFNVPVAHLDSIREEIEATLAIPSYRIWLSVSLTTNPKWL
ncbi:cation diffusion facilitator family transporter [Helicobacter sp. 23-1048]